MAGFPLFAHEEVVAVPHDVGMVFRPHILPGHVHVRRDTLPDSIINVGTPARNRVFRRPQSSRGIIPVCFFLLPVRQYPCKVSPAVIAVHAVHGAVTPHRLVQDVMGVLRPLPALRHGGPVMERVIFIFPQGFAVLFHPRKLPFTVIPVAVGAALPRKPLPEPDGFRFVPAGAVTVPAALQQCAVAFMGQALQPSLSVIQEAGHGTPACPFVRLAVRTVMVLHTEPPAFHFRQAHEPVVAVLHPAPVRVNHGLPLIHAAPFIGGAFPAVVGPFHQPPVPVVIHGGRTEPVPGLLQASQRPVGIFRQPPVRINHPFQPSARRIGEPGGVPVPVPFPYHPPFRVIGIRFRVSHGIGHGGNPSCRVPAVQRYAEPVLFPVQPYGFFKRHLPFFRVPRPENGRQVPERIIGIPCHGAQRVFHLRKVPGRGIPVFRGIPVRIRKGGDIPRPIAGIGYQAAFTVTDGHEAAQAVIPVVQPVSPFIPLLLHVPVAVIGIKGLPPVREFRLP